MNRKKSFFCFTFKGVYFGQKCLFIPHPHVGNALFLPCFFATRDRFKFANYMVYARIATNFALFKPFHKKLALFCQKQGRNKEKLIIFLFLKHNFPLFWLFFSRGRQFFCAVGNLITLISSLFFKNAYLFPPPGGSNAAKIYTLAAACIVNKNTSVTIYFMEQKLWTYM